MKTRILGLATCFNRKEKTLAAIKSLQEGNSNIDFTFIIADDNSRDGTKEALQKFNNMTVVSGDGFSYYTGGMRLAIGEALSSFENKKLGLPADTSCEKQIDYILLFNDDVDFYEGAIEGLIERNNSFSDKENAEKRIWVGPTSELDKTTLSYGGIARTSQWKPKFKIVKAEEDKGLEVDTFNANCVLIPTNIFLATGNMDPVYRHSLGDFDYGYMTRRKGAKIYVSDEFVGVCPNNSEKGTWRDPSLSRRQRFKVKESVKGVPFKEFFHYILKNYNFPAAVIFSFSPYVRILLGK